MMENGDYVFSTDDIEAGPFAALCGFSFEELRDGYCRSSAEIRPEYLNMMGFAHGGYVTALMDTTAGMAGIYANGRKRLFVTSCCDVHFIAPVYPGTVTCTASPEHIGNTTAVLRAELTDSSGRLLATGTFTYVYIE